MELLTQTYLGPAIGMVFGLWLLGRFMRNSILNWCDLPADNLSLEQIQQQFHEYNEQKQEKYAKYFLTKALLNEKNEVYALIQQLKDKKISKDEFNSKLRDLYQEKQDLIIKRKSISKEKIMNHVIDLCSTGNNKEAQNYLVEVLPITTLEAYKLVNEIQDVKLDKHQVELRINQYYKAPEFVKEIK